MLKVVNTTVPKNTTSINIIPLQPLGLVFTTLLVLQRSWCLPDMVLLARPTAQPHNRTNPINGTYNEKAIYGVVTV